MQIEGSIRGIPLSLIHTITNAAGPGYLASQLAFEGRRKPPTPLLNSPPSLVGGSSKLIRDYLIKVHSALVEREWIDTSYNDALISASLRLALVRAVSLQIKNGNIQ